jgi:hypothetical protein
MTAAGAGLIAAGLLLAPLGVSALSPIASATPTTCPGGTGPTPMGRISGINHARDCDSNGGTDTDGTDSTPTTPTNHTSLSGCGHDKTPPATTDGDTEAE